MIKFILVIFIAISSYLFSQDPYIGYWEMPNKKVIVEIKKINNEYVGYVRWLKDPKYPKGDPMEGIEQFDRKNSDPKLRKRKVMNLKVIGGLKLNEKGDALVDGWIYDSWNGKKYYGSVKVVDADTLSLKGSLDSWNIFGYSMKIKRIKE